jgi:hypothetical protein
MQLREAAERTSDFEKNLQSSKQIYQKGCLKRLFHRIFSTHIVV